MKRTFTARVGTGRAIHAAYENERGTIVGCGVIKHGKASKIQEVIAEITCKKCLARMEEEKEVKAAEPVEEEMSIKEWVEKYGKTFIVEK